jgi:hypothetical protein
MGIHEPMRGGGSFRILAAVVGAEAPAPPPTSLPRPTGLAGLWERIVRFFFRRARGPAVVRVEPTGPVTTRMIFRLRVDPGGPMAPMIDALMKPAMAAAAEDLAQRIVAHLEARAAKP